VGFWISGSIANAQWIELTTTNNVSSVDQPQTSQSVGYSNYLSRMFHFHYDMLCHDSEMHCENKRNNHFLIK